MPAPSERLFSAGRSEAAEEAFKAETVGLVEHSAFVEKRQTVEQRVLQQQLEAKRKAESAALARREEKRRKQTEQRRKQSKLTFDVDDEEEEEEEEQQQQQQGQEEEQKRAESGAAAGEHDAAPAAAKRPRLGKCPDVPTDFLPDRDREAEEARLRAQLKEEYLLEVARVKAEPLDITYSYWDGGGHRRCVTVTKGASIGEFLSACLAQLAPEFRALRAARVEHLMCVWRGRFQARPVSRDHGGRYLTRLLTPLAGTSRRT